MTTDIEFALMAGASYISTRADINQIPVPAGWLEKVEKREKIDASGFEATYFTKGTEVVISYAGTDPENFNPVTTPDGYPAGHPRARPLRPRLDICDLGIPGSHPQAPDPTEYEPQGKLLGQCTDGKLLPFPEDRFGHALRLLNPQ